MKSLQNLNLPIEHIELLLDVASRQTIEYFRTHGLKDENSVRRLLRYGLKEPIISDKVICNNKDHTAPFTFVSDILLGKILDFIVWANRSGSKTYYAGLITWIKSSYLHRRESKVLGGSFEQSEKAYKAMNGFWNITNLRDQYLEKEPMITKTTWKNGSEVSILAASQKSVRGPHPQSLILDEIDEIDQDIYEAALQQPQSKYGISASTGKLSTNHRFGGVMDLALEKAKENPLMKIYKWCIWDCLESCKDYKCSTCKLSPHCPGQQMKEANGYYKIDDFIKKLYEIAYATLQIEWFCEKIGRGDLIYGNEFDEDIHFIPKPYDHKLPVYLSLDWGGVDPFSIGVWQEFSDIGWVKIETIYRPGTTNRKVIKEVRERPYWNAIKAGVADPSRADLIEEWEDEGIPIEKADNSIEPGIEAYRNALAPVLGNPRIHFNRDGNKESLNEFNSYIQKNDKPVDKNNHTKDEERYFVMWKINKPIDEGVTVYKSESSSRVEDF